MIHFFFDRGRRRSRWKLKFHHQALPPEYLDHYEAAMAQQDAAAAKNLYKVRPVPPLVPRHSQIIKLEPESETPSTSPLTVTANAIEQLHLVTSNDEMISKVPSDANIKDDVSIVGDKVSVLNERLTTNSCERLIQSKGLLGSLLANNNNLSGMTETNEKSLISESEKKRRSVIMSSSSTDNNILNGGTSVPQIPTYSSGNSSINSVGKVMNYQDLPYMGEITLDNMKPRRGRKPKKADICHLIYKNYGTVFPGTPTKLVSDAEEWSRRKNSSGEQISHTSRKSPTEKYLSSNSKCKLLDSLKPSTTLNHTDVQNRIISSLLERRLTAVSQEAKRNMYGNKDCSSVFNREVDKLLTSNSDREPWNKQNVSSAIVCSEEPLNLCIKDLNQLKIRLLRKHGNFYEPRTSDVVTVKSEPPSPSEIEEIDLHGTQSNSESKFNSNCDVVDNMDKQYYSQTQDADGTLDGYPSVPFPSMSCPNSSTPILPFDPSRPTASPLPGGYIYWPNAGVFVHPMALQSQLLYYQKMGAIPIVPISPEQQQQGFVPSPVPQVNLIPSLSSTGSPQPPSVSPPKVANFKEPKTASNKPLIPKAFSMMMDTGSKQSVSMPPDNAFPKMKRIAPLGNPPSVGTPTKRKRSAIFIPPMPSENSSNPTTEVSICKFKFTGGAKPSLQEKKMLSVDSGGNFRYYSGTGDKSMRGYEFFPRESLQQSSTTSGGSSAEHFLAAASALGISDKVCPIRDSTVHRPYVMEDIRSPDSHNFTACSEQLTKDIESSDVLSRYAETSNVQLIENIDEQKKKIDYQDKSGIAYEIGANNVEGQYNVRESEDDPNSQFRLGRRKRKTRKSLAREKLEQTFKEKGFLIQTQQLESAEGATYCKFRQLRKFTRYLFRSWKDYLPGNVRAMSIAAGVSGSDASPHHSPEGVSEGELSSSNPPSPSAAQGVPENTATS